MDVLKLILHQRRGGPSIIVSANTRKQKLKRILLFVSSGTFIFITR